MITEVTVNAAAVESMTNDTAVVLVSATSRVTNSAGAKQEPRSWRLSRQPSARRRPDQDGESGVRTVTTNDNADVTDAEDTDADEGHRRSRRRGHARTTTRPRTEHGNAGRAAGRHRAAAGARRPGRDSGPSCWRRPWSPRQASPAWLYFEQYRPDQATNPAAATVALDAAKNGTVALLSYSPETLDKDFAAAKSHLTGDFLSYYTQFTEQIVTPAAKQKSVKTTAAVVRAAVSELHPDSAVVLVFINQNTVSKENPDGSFAASAVKVGLKKINDTWLIGSFDPV